MAAIDPAAARRATDAVPSIPRDSEGPVFREPWEAQAFAMALALHERGLFTWPEWAATLAEEIKRAQAAGDPDTGETYYHHWLRTLERLVAEKGVTSAQMLRAITMPGTVPPAARRTVSRSSSAHRISPVEDGQTTPLASKPAPRLRMRRNAKPVGNSKTSRRPRPQSSARSRCSR